MSETTITDEGLADLWLELQGPGEAPRIGRLLIGALRASRAEVERLREQLAEVDFRDEYLYDGGGQ